MILLAALLIVAYIATAVMSGAWWDIPATELLTLGASFAPAVAGGEIWRLISAIFLHGGLMHLAFNTFALIEIGRPLERRSGFFSVLTIFLLAGSWGFLASLLWHPKGISVGASGGIFGLLGALAMQMAWDVKRGSDRTETFRRYLSIGIALLLTLGLGFLIPNVDHAAHLGGLLIGLLFGLIGQFAFAQKWRWPIFFASSLILAGGLLLATQQLPASWRIEHEETQDYALRYRHFAGEDRKVSEALQAIGEASRKNQITDAESLTRLDKDILPRLAHLADELRQRQWQTPRFAEDARRWSAYAERRLAAVRALRNAIAAPDPLLAQLELARFERLITEAAQLAHEPATNAERPVATDAR